MLYFQNLGARKLILWPTIPAQLHPKSKQFWNDMRLLQNVKLRIDNYVDLLLVLSFHQ